MPQQETEERQCSKKGCPNTYVVKKGKRRMYCDSCILERISKGRPPKR